MTKGFLPVSKVPGMFAHAWSVTQLCPAVWDPVDHSPPGSSVCGISQARILEWIKKKIIMLEWVATHFFRGSSQPRDQAPVS